jgi:hypothetical protein
MNKILITAIYAGIIGTGCNHSETPVKQVSQEPYQDAPFPQEYSIKYYLNDQKTDLLKIVCDRNGYIQILTSDGLMKPAAGEFLWPGTLEKDLYYRPVSDKKISGVTTLNDQIVYLDDKAVLSNAWAGKLYSPHSLPGARIFCGGSDNEFLVSDGKNLQLIRGKSKLWEGFAEGDEVKGIKYDRGTNYYWILGSESLYRFDPDKGSMERMISDKSLTCFELTPTKVIAGTTDGYFTLDNKSGKKTSDILREMPCPEITAIKMIDGILWFGSASGAMRLRKDRKFDYFASVRWLPSDTVIDFTEGPENSVLVLTNRGMAKICTRWMTLSEKAEFYQKQVRERHIRNGFNAAIHLKEKGNISTGTLQDSDNDGLWTSMYLAAEAFRYSVTGEPDALQNVRESLEAMERLYNITNIPGFPARSFERRGYKFDDEPWRRADDPEWDWKSTTSSDEAIGHIFAFGVVAELVNDAGIMKNAVELIDTLMSHILKNNYYLIDWNGKPTRWGRWNPGYVNAFPEMVGDRKLNSSNIAAMLQTAFHFTKKEKYREAILSLFKDHGYLKNLMKPINEIGVAPENSDALSRMLSEEWNHSDDEMYFCGYWGLYRYALNDTLKEMYRKAITDHWQAERAEKEGLWNIMTSMTGIDDSDMEEAVWYLKEYPLDMIGWSVSNSKRQDIEPLARNFRGQTIKEVLPPDELKIARHNANRFDLDGGDNGHSEMSAGDIWLLPYWMGRYLGVISEPKR